MSELRIVANAIPTLKDLTAWGHLQIIKYSGDLQSAPELEVQSPSSIGLAWQFEPVQAHGDKTPFIGQDDYYRSFGIDIGDRSVDDVWDLLLQTHSQFRIINPIITYSLGSNSNSYVNTLLSIVGIDATALLGAVTPPKVSSFPGVYTNVLTDSRYSTLERFINYYTIPLDLKGGNGHDIICTGIYDDILFGGAGKDELYGNDGADTLFGGQESSVYLDDGVVDKLFGGTGNDKYIVERDVNDRTESYTGFNGDVQSFRGKMDEIYDSDGEGNLQIHYYGKANIPYLNGGPPGPIDLNMDIEGEYTLSYRNDEEVAFIKRFARETYSLIKIVDNSAYIATKYAYYSHEPAVVIMDFRQGDFGISLEGYIGKKEGTDRDDIIQGGTSERRPSPMLVEGATQDLSQQVVILETDPSSDQRIHAGAGNDLAYGRGGCDEMRGDEGDDTLYGDEGDDRLSGGDGADALNGGVGDDVLIGGADADVLDGGDGVDTASYSGKTTAVTLTLNLASDATVTVGGAAEDTVRNIENIIGGSGNDQLTGDGLANSLTGGAGNDTLSGAAGNDTLGGGAGSDLLDGGAGVDTADYSDKTTAVVVTLNGATDAIVIVGGAAEDTIRNIENIIGGSGTDTLGGDGLANVLDGGAGADRLVGGAGNDTYVVDNAGDVVVENAGEGSDLIRTRLGSYTLDANVDNLAYTGRANFAGAGNALANELTGGAGDDTLTGGAGSDTYVYNAGDGLDTIVEGSAAGDTDKLVLGAGILASDVVVTRSSTDTDDAVLTFKNRTGSIKLDEQFFSTTQNWGVEQIRFADGTTWDRAAILAAVASTGGGPINGTAGDDVLIGTNGADTINGLDGNDVLKGLGGVDTLDGGAGVDTADYSDKTTAVVATLNGATNASVTVGGAAEDTIRNMENLIGGSGADRLTGDGLANLLDGGAGADTLAGAAGNDIHVVDNTGDVVMEAASAGTDLVRTTLASYTLGANVENLAYLGAAAFTGTGNTVSNTLSGGTGNDVLKGLGGNDTLDGGDGVDTADYSDKAETVSLVLNGATDTTITLGGVAEDTIRNIENLIGGSGADTLTGDGLANTLTGGAGADTLNGMAGDDLLHGGAGADVLDGGAGIDTVSYAGSSASVTVLLWDAGTGGDAQEDTYIDIEAVIGSSLADWISGQDHVGETLKGGAGNDELYGFGGNDVLEGEGDNDYLNGGAGDDTLNGGDGNDELDANEGTDELNGGNGDDSLKGWDGNDTLRGGAGNDSFVFIPNLGQDVITDFTAGAGSVDVIEFNHTLFADYMAVMAKATQSGADAIITLDALNAVTLKNVTASNLHVDDFYFV